MVQRSSGSRSRIQASRPRSQVPFIGWRKRTLEVGATGLITDDNTLLAPVFPDARSPTQSLQEVPVHFGVAS